MIPVNAVPRPPRQHCSTGHPARLEEPIMVEAFSHPAVILFAAMVGMFALVLVPVSLEDMLRK